MIGFCDRCGAFTFRLKRFNIYWPDRTRTGCYKNVCGLCHVELEPSLKEHNRIAELRSCLLEKHQALPSHEIFRHDFKTDPEHQLYDGKDFIPEDLALVLVLGHDDLGCLICNFGNPKYAPKRMVVLRR